MSGKRARKAVAKTLQRRAKIAGIARALRAEYARLTRDIRWCGYHAKWSRIKNPHASLPEWEIERRVRLGALRKASKS